MMMSLFYKHVDSMICIIFIYSNIILISLSLVIAINYNNNTKRYSYEIVDYNYSLPYRWGEVKVTDNFPDDTDPLISVLSNPLKYATDMVDIPVYVSMASVSYRGGEVVYNAIRTILEGAVAPTKIFLFISKEPFLRDKGVKEVEQSLLALSAHGKVTIVYTTNVGPHRMLLPVLKRFYHDDVLIITLDDDSPHMFSPQSYVLYHILKAYRDSDGNSVIGPRVERIGMCNDPSLEEFLGAFEWKILKPGFEVGVKEMLLFPAGVGGILYRPRFLHPVVFEESLRGVTVTNDDITFRLACMANNVSVIIACRDPRSDEYFDQFGHKKCDVEESFRFQSYNNTIEQPLHRFLSDNDRRAQIEIPQSVPKHTAELIGEFGSRETSDGKLALHIINRMGGAFNHAWLDGLAYLHNKSIVDVPMFIKNYYYERNSSCYTIDDPWFPDAPEECALLQCPRQSIAGTGERWTISDHTPDVRYTYKVEVRNSDQPYGWSEVVVTDSMAGAPDNIVSALLRPLKTASDMVAVPVYASVISNDRQNWRELFESLLTILNGAVVPTHTFLFLPKSRYTIRQEALALVAHGLITIVYTSNEGILMQALPMLKRFYNNDVLLFTVPDNLPYKAKSYLLYHYLDAYRRSNGTSVVASRVQRITICQYLSSFKVVDKAQWPSLRSGCMILKKEMLVVPSSEGPILYRPQFFHPIIFNSKFQSVTIDSIDHAFRLSCMLNRIPVIIPCNDDGDEGCGTSNSCAIDPAFRLTNRANNYTKNNTIQVYQDDNWVLKTHPVVNKGISGKVIDARVNDEIGGLFYTPSWRNGQSYIANQGLLDFDRLVRDNIHERAVNNSANNNSSDNSTSIPSCYQLRKSIAMNRRKCRNMKQCNH